MYTGSPRSAFCKECNKTVWICRECRSWFHILRGFVYWRERTCLDCLPKFTDNNDNNNNNFEGSITQINQLSLKSKTIIDF